jgi:hypothetical protein
MNAPTPGQQPPTPPRATSATIQNNADKILAIVEAEKNNAIASLTPQLTIIEHHLVQLQGRVAQTSTLDADAARELVGLQAHFSEFRNSCGVLTANAARIKELEELVAQLTADNYGLHTSVSTAVRDAALARTKEEQASNVLAAFLKQLAPIGIGQREDGTLGFSSDWKVILDTLQNISRDPSGRLDILRGLSMLAAKMRDVQERAARPPGNPREFIDMVNWDTPPGGPS